MPAWDETAPWQPHGPRPTPGSKRQGAGGGVLRPRARASCKPHPGSPGAADPPRPSLRSRSPEPLSATRSHGSGRPRAPGSPRTPARGARTRRLHAGESGRRRKEGTAPPRPDTPPWLGEGEGEGRPGNLRLGREGRGGDCRRAGQRMGRQGLARTRGLLQGWGLLQALALWGGGSAGGGPRAGPAIPRASLPRCVRAEGPETPTEG